MIRLKAPNGVTHSNIEGRRYDVVDGHVTAMSLGDAQILRQHGYKPPDREVVAAAPTPAAAAAAAATMAASAPAAAPASPAEPVHATVSALPSRKDMMEYLEERNLKQRGNVSNAELIGTYTRVKADNDALEAAAAADNDPADEEEAE